MLHIILLRFVGKFVQATYALIILSIILTQQKILILDIN